MENWREDAGIGHTHEPNEVTVQLDGIGRKLGELPAGPQRSDTQDGSDGPVFVDESGRRSKKFRRVGWVLAAACACYAVTLVAALIGGDSTAPLLPGFGQQDKERSGSVEVQPTAGVGAPTVATPFAPGAPTPTDAVGSPVPGPTGSASGTVSGGLPADPAPGTSGSASPNTSGGGAPVPGAPSSSSSPGGGGTAPGPDPGGSPPGPSPSDSGPTGLPTEPAAPVQEGTL
ncbi:hypothetical protein [Streptomyces sp. NPDC020681]|uniref:hypothetical protein n=1 Tax=Streptomyces sp. NPDC020681 TaxID=3365083 RepID=UPI0037B59E5A